MISRRALLALGLYLGTGTALARARRPLRVAALFAGRIDDKGFMESGYRGLELAKASLGCDIDFIQGIPPKPDMLEQALRQLASAAPDMIVAHGGQNDAAALVVAKAFPKLRFVVTQGSATAPNLSSYEVVQEQSAFLAGALAAWSTRTGVVGHMSGIRVIPGLKGRAAFVAGVAHVDPAIRVLTNFSGSQDDNALSHRVASAMIDARADIIFTMLNAGRSGAIAACRERGIFQIGNVIDWTRIAPDVFIASAMADSGLALFNAVADLAAGHFVPGVVRRIGLDHAQAVRLALGEGVKPEIARRLMMLSADIVAGRLTVDTEYDGPDFPNPV
ncbi:MAG: BMP family protein [Sphingobium sp.]